MSQTTGVTLKEEEAAYSALLGVTGQLLRIFGLLGGLYGVLTVLSVQSVYALVQRKTRRIQPSSIILCFIILTLFISTTTYLITVALGYQYLIGASFFDFVRWLGVHTDKTFENLEMKGIYEYLGLEYCVGTAALTFNITLGDAIVCWRVSIVWQRNLVVRTVCGAFLLATFVLGIIDTTRNACQFKWNSSQFGDGSMYQGVPIGISVCVLSFSTNLLATLFVGYKAWQWRRHLKGYLVSGSQVEKLLALLIESGGAYCVLWGTIVAYQVIEFHAWYSRSVRTTAEESFVDIFTVVLDGGLVPLVAIYPTIIIVLVAHNRSQIEKGLLRNLDSMPTPNLAVTVNTTMTTEATQPQTSEVLVIGPDGQATESTDEVEEADMRTSKEWESGSMA